MIFYGASDDDIERLREVAQEINHRAHEQLEHPETWWHLVSPMPYIPWEAYAQQFSDQLDNRWDWPGEV